MTPEWFNIGLKLGIEYHELEVIRLDRMQRGGISECFTAMLELWLHRIRESPNEIWITVCEVLRELKENRLANTIPGERAHVKPREAREVAFSRAFAYNHAISHIRAK